MKKITEIFLNAFEFIFALSFLQVFSFMFVSAVGVWLIFIDQFPQHAEIVARALQNFTIWSVIAILGAGYFVGLKLFKIR
jgi:hypothetical protein